MTMDNLRYWNTLHKAPLDALKRISGGRMNGKTDINPTWRTKAMTELFGPCGEGWAYTIDRLWTEPGEGGNVTAMALVSVRYWIDSATKQSYWSEPIPGIGGSMLVTKESSGFHTSDEAYKMAVTDALSVALKALGVAAEIYMGNFDGSKYKDAAPPPAPKVQPIDLERLVGVLASMNSVKELESEYKSVDFQARLAVSDKAAVNKAVAARKAALVEREAASGS